MAAIELYSTPLISDSDLLAYFRFQGNSNDYKSTYNGTDTSMSYSDSYGKFGNGAYFSGSGRIDCGSTPIPTAGAGSVSFWMNSSQEGLATIFSNGGVWDADYAGFYIWQGSGGKLHFHHRSGVSNGQDDRETTIDVFDGTWRHLVHTWTGDTSSNGQKTYINGSLDGQWTPTFNEATPSTNRGVYLGSARDDSNTYNYTGYLDDFAVFNRVLTATEVSNLYNGTWTSIKTFNGLAKASVKTINGLAIASVKTINGLA